MIFPDIFHNLKVNAFFTDKTESINKENLSKIAGNNSIRYFYLPIQQHTDNVIILTDDFTPQVGDAVITQRKDVLIGVKTADCVPILLFDKKYLIISSVHAGWRGAAKGILKKVIHILIEEFSSGTENILIAMGPSVGSCCYNVGEDIINELKKITGEGDYIKRQENKWYIDLSKVNQIQALSLGLDIKNIWLSKKCTSCKSHKYHSYRKDKESTKRQGGFIRIGL